MAGGATIRMEVDMPDMDVIASRLKQWNDDWWHHAELMQVEVGKLKTDNEQLRAALLGEILGRQMDAKLRIPAESIPMALAGAAVAATSSPRRFSRRRLFGLR